MRVNEQGAKNPGRIRVIPLNDKALEAMTRAIERGRSLGAGDPQHIFPFRVHKGLLDPCRYQTTFKTAWRELTAAAGLEKGIPDVRSSAPRHHGAPRRSQRLGGNRRSD
jgi:integrase